MTFWDMDWFNLRKVAQLQKDLAEANWMLSRLGDNILACQTEKATYFNAIKQLEKVNRDLGNQIAILNASLNNKDTEIQALKDSLDVTLKDALEEINQLTLTRASLNETIDSLNAELEEANSKPAPPSLKDLGTYIKTLKGTPDFDNPKLWYDCLKSLFIVFGKPEITDSVIVRAEVIQQKILAAFPGIPLPPLKDGNYKLIKIDQAMAIVKGSYTAIGTWIEDFFDCDKHAQNMRDFFAFYYLVNSCAEVWGTAPFGYHSWNIIVCSDGIICVEPQSNTMAILPEVLYKIEQVHDL